MGGGLSLGDGELLGTSERWGLSLQTQDGGGLRGSAEAFWVGAALVPSCSRKSFQKQAGEKDLAPATGRLESSRESQLLAGCRMEPTRASFGVHRPGQKSPMGILVPVRGQRESRVSEVGAVTSCWLGWWVELG